ncbi:hypothetical protein [Streptomyces sp. NPDC048636]|uniref:hypothetical protein n=1 Tax=Streptomyces sp. NPDC048636 TaxID=3155762 RepID=UPI0034458A2A
MTIMPSGMPVNPTGMANEVQDTINEVFPLYAEVQMLAQRGVYVSVEVAPSKVVVTIKVARSVAATLPELLAHIDDTRPGQLPSGQLAVTGTMCQGSALLRVLIPESWVSAEELALLTGSESADPTSLL